MFCAIATTIERCKTEGVVDVFQVVKALRVQKPGAVRTVVRTAWYLPYTLPISLSIHFIFLQVQYQVIFEALLVFLDSFSTYANF